MIKILHRYIVKEFLGSFAFGLIVFSAILLIDQIFQFVDLFLARGVAFWLVLQLFLLVIPTILSLTIPMAILFGVLISYGRFAEDNEITVMKATGVDYKTLAMPVIVFVAIISLGLVFFNHDLAPSTHKYFRTLYKNILTQTPLAKFNEKTITDIGDYKFYAHKVNSKNNTMEGINIYKFSDKNSDDNVPWRIASSSATIKVTGNKVMLKLYNGYWQRTEPNKPGSIIHTNFHSYQFEVPIDQNISFDDLSLKELSSKKLRAKIKKIPENDQQIYTYKNEYWLRWILSIAPIAFVIIAVPIGIMAGKGGKAISFGMSLGVILIYYMLLIVGINLGEKGIIPSAIILWLPNMVITLIGLMLFKKMSKK